MRFEMRQDYYPIYTLGGYCVEDLKWKYIDKNGHSHYYDSEKNLATLNRCSEIEIRYDYYGDEWEDETVWYECKECSEIIKPGTIHKDEPLYQYGKVHYFIDGVTVPKTRYMEEFKKEYDRTK